MIGTSFASYIREKTSTNSTTFTDADIVLRANIIKDEMADQITEAFQDFFLIPYTDSLVADQREYALPNDYIKVKQIEAKLDGTSWIKLDPFDINNYRRPTNDTDIKSNFSTANAKYDLFRGSFQIYSGADISAVTNGLKAWFIVYPADISADGSGSTLNLAGTDDLSIAPTTTTLGFPRSFHRLWADAIIVDYKNSKDRPIPLSEGEQMWNQRMQQAIQMIKDTNVDDMVGLVGEDAWTMQDPDAGFNY